MKKRICWLLCGLLLLAGLMLTACGGEDAATKAPESADAPAATEAPAEPAADEPSEPKILRMRINADIQNMDPANYTSQSDVLVTMTILNGLVRYAPNSYELENQLAETIEMSDDGLVISFKLHEGVMWQGGYGELTTQDVKFSFERFIDPDQPAVYADDWAALDHVEIIDQYNGQIILKEPLATLWSTTLPVSAGSIVCKKQVEEIGLERLATELVGTGPYVLDEWKPKEAVILKRNPDYFGETPAWDEIHFIPIEDDMAAEIALEAGELDFGGISISSIERFEQDSRFTLLKQPTLAYSWIGMNVENPKLQDINVRQAIRYAIDVPSILAAAYMGQAEQATTMVAPGLLGYWEEAPRYERDVEKAREFMALAGLESLDLEFACQDTTEYRTWGEIAQQNLAEIGINLTITPMDSSTFWSIGEGEAGKEVELFSMEYSMNPDPAWASMWFVCDQVGIWNWQRWCSPEYDELHRQGLITLDLAARADIYVEMEQLWDAAAHSIWITHSPVAFAHSPNIKPATTPHGVVQAAFFEPVE